MKHVPFRTILVLLVIAVLSLSATGCDWIASLFAGTGSDRPAIPAPESYLAEVPLVSDELIVATVPLTDFTPRVVTAYNAEGNEIVTVSGGERVALVDNGNPEPAPTVAGQTTQPLANIPHLQLVRYWQRVGSVERYSGATTTTIERSVTRGSSTTETESFAYSIGVSTTVSGGGAFASASLTVSAEFSGEFESEYTIEESVTETESYSVAAEQDENLVFAVYQLVEEYRFVHDNSGTWEPYEDPGYEFVAADLEPLAVPVDDVRNISWEFPNRPRGLDAQ